MFIPFLIAVFALTGALCSAIHIAEPKPDKFDLQQRQYHGFPSPGYNPGDWVGWGGNVYNNRVAAPGAAIDAANVATLESVCKEDYAYGVSATPLVINGVAYYPTWGGLLVALDYHKCKVLWQTNITQIIQSYKPVSAAVLSVAKAASRTTPVLDGNALILGTIANALLLAVDRHSGKLIDKIQISDHPVGIVTMSPTVWQGRIFVGASSQEEAAVVTIPGYVCCSFIGNMQALALEHGHFTSVWKQDMIPAGSNFSGVAVWGSQPPIDPVRQQVFIGTGNVYSVPPSYEACTNATANSTSTNGTDPCAPPGLYQETVLALDTETGKINWFHELSPLDAWTVACIRPGLNNTNACPPNPGPDADFGMAPSFIPGSASTPSGVDTIVIGQKNGNLYGLSAEAGKLFWATATSPDGTEGGLIWGVAVDASAVYYTAVNSNRVPWKLQNGTELSNGAFGAASLATGEILWDTAVPRNSRSFAIPSVVNDVVLVGTSGPYVRLGTYNGPGSLVALDKHTGEIIKETMLDNYFQGGIAVVQDNVLFGTGYSETNTNKGSFIVWKLTK